MRYKIGSKINIPEDYGGHVQRSQYRRFNFIPQLLFLRTIDFFFNGKYA